MSEAENLDGLILPPPMTSSPAPVTLPPALRPRPTLMEGRAAEPPRRPYNQVFDHLVDNDDDVIGLIAYALYKQDKREWLMNWRKQEGAEATPDQLTAFVTTQMSAGQRDRYRTAARQVLDAYAFAAVDTEKPLITERAVSERIERAARRVEAGARWSRAIPAAILGAILVAAALIGGVYGLRALDVNVAGFLGLEATAPVVPVRPAVSAAAPRPAAAAPVGAATPAANAVAPAAATPAANVATPTPAISPAPANPLAAPNARP